jgi:hypothetical protein
MYAQSVSSAILRLPLWLRYAIAISTATIIFVALVIYVHDHQAQSEGLPASPSRAQAAQEQKQDEVVIGQQQAPHVVRLATGTAPLQAARAAVHRYVTDQVSQSQVAGPVDGPATCTAGGGSPTRLLFHCNVRAGSAATQLRYPFVAVVVPSAARVTYCQVVTPPYPVKAVPISAACR